MSVMTGVMAYPEIVLASAAAIRITAKPEMSTYSWLPFPEPPTFNVTWIKCVTLREVESPFMPVARTVSVWRPGAIVPVLTVSVDTAPSFVGETLDDEKEIDPTPTGSGVSTDSATGFPKFVFLFGAFWSWSVKVAVPPVATSKEIGRAHV